MVQRANKYIDETAPWLLAKDEAKLPRLAAVLYNLCEVLRTATVLLTPFMPGTTPKMAAQLGLAEESLRFEIRRPARAVYRAQGRGAVPAH